MTKNEMMDMINNEDFIIRVRPFADDDGDWSGEIDISIMAFPENPMDDEDYSNVMHLCKMMCSTVPIMEQEESIRQGRKNRLLEVNSVYRRYVSTSIQGEQEVVGFRAHIAIFRVRGSAHRLRWSRVPFGP